MLWMVTALGWWGFLYPELCLTPDTYRAVNEQIEEQDEETLSATELYYKLLSAQPEEVKIKTKLWETVKAYFEKSKVK